jgi:predicted nucleic acid-binding Zn ribbon protein
VFQKFTDEPLTECPECGSPIRKIFQPVGIVFKGSGWYINDSRKSDTSPGDSASAKASTPVTESPTAATPAKSDTADAVSKAPMAEPAKAAAD